jgi:hypothetical protein
MNFNDPMFCQWAKLSNVCLNWYGMDSEEHYQKNLKSNYDKLLKNDWIGSSFTYKFNSAGFRCNEFTDADSIMFLGCSVTLGTGLPVESTFPELLSKQLNLQCINLGVSGSSADTGFRLAQIYLKTLKPKIVVTTFLFPERTELLTLSGDIHFNPKSYNKNRKYYIEYYEKWLECSETAQLQLTKNTLAIHKMCDDLNIKFINNNNFVLHPSCVGKARDLMHPGRDYHQQLSNSILNQL